MTSGRVSTSRSLLPLRSRGCVLKRSPRKSASVSWCALDHRAHRAVEDEDPAAPAGVERRARVRFTCLRVFVSCVVACGFVPDAMSTVNGSPALRAPTPTRTSRSPAPSACRSSSSSPKPETPIAELGAHPFLAVRPQIEDEHAPAGRRDPRRLGDRARRIAARGGAPATAARRRPAASLIGSLLELAALPDDVRHAAPPRRALRARSRTDVGPIDGDHPRRPARRFDRQIAFAAAEIGDLRAAAAACRARATTRPSSAPARAAARRACRRRRACRSSPSAAAALPAAAPRRRARPDRSPPRRTARSSAGHRARCPSSRSAGASR